MRSDTITVESGTGASAPARYGQYVIFDLDGDLYGIDVMRSQEVVELDRIRPLPDGGDLLRGVIDLRGTVLPVVDLGRRMGMRGGDGPAAAIIILQVRGSLLGIVVTAVVDVVEIARAEIQEAPRRTMLHGGDLVEGVCLLAGRMTVLIDAERILADGEINDPARGA